ncbi:MAG: sulfurtransferase TusA family protein [Fulvimarina manganoxydans]|uniref:sulfurtransferase TusA family protein n=1 Tax=Fulvimarina manganoxydans TaxID=937218 RepID=UPI0023567817|nr:sulfurtransferase TusA family protein [Fulvimarina manganoxydans]MCK5931441.1 sulfurtransferase TusA family protein [Fulvimarina manganoxydans]
MTQSLDLRGLKCPLPTLKTRKALLTMTKGERLTILADDPMAAIDIPHFCNEAGHRLVEMIREGENRLCFVIEATGH